jgi:hypothetical protein
VSRAVELPDGTVALRLAFGREPGDVFTGMVCEGCGARRGHVHVVGCEVERCPRSGCRGRLAACLSDGCALLSAGGAAAPLEGAAAPLEGVGARG